MQVLLLRVCKLMLFVFKYGQMRCIFTFLVCTMFFEVHSQVPDWAWASTAGSSGDDEATSVAADVSGNVYVTGHFSGGSLVAGSFTLSNPSPGNRQFFLIKYDRTGAVLWAKSAGGSDDDEGTSVAVDGSGNVYVCGSFESASINFGTAALNNNSNAGLADIFLVKYNAAGSLQWAKTYGDGLQEVANDIAVDAAGNIAMTGNFFSLSVLFGNYGVINSGVSDAFVAKFNTNGSALWAKRIGGGQTDNGVGVGIDGNGNVYVAGDYNSNTVSSFSPALSNSGGFDIFLAKFDNSGNVLFSQRYGGSGDESPTALHVQSNGNIFLCGYFESGSLQFGTTTISNVVSRSMFLARMSNAGVAQWAQKYSGTQNSIPSSLAQGGTSIYMSGSFDMTSVTFGSSTLNKSGALDAFVIEHDMSNGNVLWARNTGSQGLEQSNGVAVGEGHVHIAGLFTGTLVLRDNNLPAEGSSDAFVSKLCNPPAAPLSASGSTVCPGVPLTLNANTPPGTGAVWYNASAGGTPVHQGSTYSPGSSATFYVASRDTNSGCGMYSNTRLPASGAYLSGPQPTVSVSGHTLSAAGNGSVSAWYNCESTQTVSGQTNSNYVINTTGHYAVIMVSPQGCVDTSACNHYSYTPGQPTVIVTPGVSENSESQITLKIYPNPSTGFFTVTSNGQRECIIVNALGMEIERFVAGDAVRVGPLDPGLYFVVPVQSRQVYRVVVTR